ncbi:MAG: hypothetical protein DME85_00375 [Verrucomicrobia bacterium]|nr:MAG: hypothetical protein DME85_00375 [Verrucomicrobiota bacterium]
MIGVLIVIGSLLYLLSALILFLNPYYPHAAPAIHYLLTGGLGLVLGWYFLRGAPLLVGIAYGRKQGTVATPKV